MANFRLFWKLEDAKGDKFFKQISVRCVPIGTNYQPKPNGSKGAKAADGIGYSSDRLVPGADVSPGALNVGYRESSGSE